MLEHKQKYELAMLLKPLLPEDIKDRVVKKLEALVADSKGELTTKLPDMWGKKHLAYRLQRQEEGYYAFFTLEIPATQVKKLEREMKLNQDVLRYLLLSEDQL